MKDNVLKVFNEQINFELSSAYLYLGLSLKMEELNYKGYSNWLYKQYQEELEHAGEFIRFAQKRGVTVSLADILAPTFDVDNPLTVAKMVLSHEQKVTSAIYKLHDVAKTYDDYATEIFLHSFINEQIEEEDTARDIVDKFTFAGDNQSTRYTIDRELAGR